MRRIFIAKHEFHVVLLNTALKKSPINSKIVGYLIQPRVGYLIENKMKITQLAPQNSYFLGITVKYTFLYDLSLFIRISTNIR